MIWLAAPLLLLSLAGLGYTIHAGLAVGRFARLPLPEGAAPEPVTLLKPLHGAEPKLAENLASFLDQDWGGPIEMVCGVQRADDPAIGVVDRLLEYAPSGLVQPPPLVPSAVEARAAGGLLGARPSTTLGTSGGGVGFGTNGAGVGPERQVRMILDPTRHGANAKIGNILNMMPAARHDLLILSDSDIAVPRDYVRTVAATLGEPGVGAVSLLYRGRGDAGFWSVLGAGAISYAFVPAVLLGRALGRVEPCMGSTIALRRGTLERIGGFAAFRDILADDGAIGAAVQALGLHVAMPRLIVNHGCVETSLAAVWRHELRWAATIRHHDAKGYRGLILTHPLPFALLALPFAPVPAGALLLVWACVRGWQVARIDRLLGTRSMPRAWLPLRDVLSFTIFVASFFTRSVDWRGVRLVMEQDGRIARPAESFVP